MHTRAKPMQNTGSHKKRWIIVGGVALLLIVLLLFVDVEAVFRLLRRTNWWLWFSGVLLLLVGYTINSVRWRYLLVGKPGRRPLFYGDSIAYMLNMFTPVPIMLSRVVTTGWLTPVSIPQATSGMVVDRLLEVMMRVLAFIYVLVLLAARYTDANASMTVLASLGLLFLAVAGLAWISKHHETVADRLAHWLSHLPRLNEAQLRKVLGNLLQGLAYASSTRHLLVGLLISVAMWACFLSFQYLVFVALPPSSLFEQGLVIALVVLVVVPPSTPAMIGAYQAIVIGMLLGLRLMDIDRATAYAIILYLPQLLFWLLAGAWALSRTDVKFKELMQAAKTRSQNEKLASIPNNGTG